MAFLFRGLVLKLVEIEMWRRSEGSNPLLSQVRSQDSAQRDAPLHDSLKPTY